MQRNLTAFSESEFDLVIVGGGITGACLAWDAVNRGYTVALVEKGDFGASTSSASSKLLHGGIRYLQQGRFDKVRESAMERVYYQTLAPHLCQYVPFAVPTYPGLSKGKWLLRFAMWLYQLICAGQNRHIRDSSKKVPGWKMLSKSQFAASIPEFNFHRITGAALFYESHMQSSERMTLAFIESSILKGAKVANYVNVDGFLLKNGKVCGVTATDLMENKPLQIKAACVINAAGPWIPLLNKSISTRSIVTAFSKGAHIVTSPVTKNVAVALPTQKQNQAIVNRGGRHVFIIPWRGCSLIGTTYDSYHGELDKVRPDEHDIEELISDINSAFGNEVLTRRDVKYSFAGIYPLIDDKINTKVYQGTGEYQIVDHQLIDGIEGLVTVFGAKFTTARLLAEKALDEIGVKFNKPLHACRTKTTALACGDIDDISAFRQRKKAEYKAYLSEQTIDHLVTYYGNNIDKLITYVKDDPQWASPLATGYPDIAAQIVFAAEQELTCHLDDILFRRTGLGTLGNPGTDVIDQCAAIVSEVFAWDDSTRQAEIDRVLAYYDYSNS